MIHCDDIINDANYPECLRYFLKINRMVALEKCKVLVSEGVPRCFATYQGETVRLTMASRFGDVGATKNLTQERGYEIRAYLDDFIDFRSEP